MKTCTVAVVYAASSSRRVSEAQGWPLTSNNVAPALFHTASWFLWIVQSGWQPIWNTCKLNKWIYGTRFWIIALLWVCIINPRVAWHGILSRKQTFSWLEKQIRALSLHPRKVEMLAKELGNYQEVTDKINPNLGLVMKLTPPSQGQVYQASDILGVWKPKVLCFTKHSQRKQTVNPSKPLSQKASTKWKGNMKMM